MAPPLRVMLDQAAHDEPARRYHTTRDATTRTRYQMVLLRAEATRSSSSPSCGAAAPTPSAGSSSATWPAGPTRCRIGRLGASGPTGRQGGRPSCCGSWSWTPTRWASTARCGPAGCWPTT